MSRGPSTFRQQDVARALRAATAAGLIVHRFEIDRTGKIVVVAANGQYAASDPSQNEWDAAPAGEAGK
jgi:hypothetical protein